MVKAGWLFWVGLLASTGPQSPDVSLTFHHLHFETGDPSAAIRSYADRLNGTRTLLPGLGVGVQVGSEYVLFDRLTERSRPGGDGNGCR